MESSRVAISKNLNNIIDGRRRDNKLYAVVYDVITKEDDDLAVSKDVGVGGIGSVQFRFINNKSTTTSEDLPIAYPLNKNLTTLPVRNEIVVIHEFGGSYHYSRLGGDITPNVNTFSNLISQIFGISTPSESNSKNYQNVSQTGITEKSNTGTNSETDGYGTYFNPQNISKLRLYEGDTLLESRFGQSIRLSGYNNPNNEFYPTITIRNGQQPNTETQQTEENINNDGGIIFLSSGDRLLNYTLPTANKKESFFKYPNELKGNQILLNSDRIILSAKTEQMIFAAKQDIGFITDSVFSIDTTQGINITSNGDIHIDSKKKSINLDTGGGKINLGFKAGDSGIDYAVKGKALQNILRDFMEVVGQQIMITPAGQTAPGATNKARLNTLIERLGEILSENVQLK